MSKGDELTKAFAAFTDEIYDLFLKAGELKRQMDDHDDLSAQLLGVVLGNVKEKLAETYKESEAFSSRLDK